MTVGEFHDASRRALRAVDFTADHPIEDLREAGDSLAAASLLCGTLAKHLRDAAGDQKWGADARKVAERLSDVPTLSGTADATRAQHPIARLFLAAAAAVGLERDILAGHRDPLDRAARLWLTRAALDRTVMAAHGMEVLAERLRTLHRPTEDAVAAFAVDVARLADRARATLASTDVEVGHDILALRAGPQRYTDLLRDLPEALRPALGRLLVTANRFDHVAPPHRSTLRVYAHVLAAGATSLDVVHVRLGASKAAESWRAAAHAWDRLRYGLVDVATLGRPDPRVHLAGREVLVQLLRWTAPGTVTGDRVAKSAEVAAMSVAIRRLADDQARIAAALAARNGVYSPSRLLPEPYVASWERRMGPATWLPMPPTAADTLANRYRDATQHVSDAATLSDHAAKNMAAARRVPLTALEQLARTRSLRTGSPHAPPRLRSA